MFIIKNAVKFLISFFFVKLIIVIIKLLNKITINSKKIFSFGNSILSEKREANADDMIKREFFMYVFVILAVRRIIK